MSEEESLRSSDSESESESDHEEPLFRYSRITQLPRTFFGKDPVSSVLVSHGIIAIGSHSGVLHLNNEDFTKGKTTRIHRASISDTDCDGSYIATCSIDGTIVITSLEDDQDVQPINMRRPVHAIALDPSYKLTRSYLSGGTSGAVTLSSRGWIKTRSDAILEQSSGTILAIAWQDQRAIWCSEDGISVYDSSTNSILGKFPRSDHSGRTDPHRPTIFTRSLGEWTALVAWGKTLWMIDLLDARVVKRLRLDWFISGVRPFDDSHFVLLCCELNCPPELRVINQDGYETYVDELTMQGYERLGPNDYHLRSSSNDGNMWYIVSATDAVIARLRDAHDHITWLMEEGQFYTAYKESHGVISDEDRLDVGLKAAEMLVEEGNWKDVGQVLGEVLPAHDNEKWSQWAERFIDAGKDDILGAILPDVDLGNVHTEIVLRLLDNNRMELLKQFLSHWDLARLDKPKIIFRLEKLETSQSKDILAELYLRLSEPFNAVRSYLWMSNSKAFVTVKKYHLWNDMISYLPRILLCGIDKDSQELQDRIEVLVSSHLEISPSKVVTQLKREKDSLLLFFYLRSLSLEDEFLIKDFGDLMVTLYAQHDREKLLSFLTLNGTYNLNDAITICERDDYVDELIYLYGQVGHSQKALDLIINELNDAKRAVQFAVDHKDQDLWNYLIMYARDKPDFVLQLLQCPQVRPARVLETVPHTLRIPGLRDALYNVLRDQRAVLFLNEGALQIVRAEAREHLNHLQRARKEGHFVDNDADADWSKPVILESSGLQEVDLALDLHSKGWLARKLEYLESALRYINPTY